MSPKTSKKLKPLTESELEIMNCVWKFGECTVKQVQDELIEVNKKKPAYTSVATFMKILVEKGFLTCSKETRVHTFLPKIDKSTYESSSLSHLTQNVFLGSPSQMVLKLLDESKLTIDEIESIRKKILKLKGEAK